MDATMLANALHHFLALTGRAAWSTRIGSRVEVARRREHPALAATLAAVIDAGGTRRACGGTQERSIDFGQHRYWLTGHTIARIALRAHRETA
jgi:hypothetical protein